MRNAIAYFIGGPLDLTKTAIPHVETILYSITKTALTLNEVYYAQDAKLAIDFIKNRHRYRMMGRARVVDSESPVIIYAYDGTEMDGPGSGK